MANRDDQRCARCGHPETHHLLANYVDVSGDPLPAVRICPTATFDPTDGPHAHANAVKEIATPPTKD